jgi:hypothetical protein
MARLVLYQQPEVILMRSTKLLWSTALTAAFTLAGPTLDGPQDAAACGGCFVPSEAVTQVTGHRMVLSLSQERTTLYDQIEYEGSPESFAWVLPIKGVADIGLLPDLVFQTLDDNSKIRIQAPPPPCAPCDNLGASASVGSSASTTGGGGVTIVAQEVVGPYETVQLSAEDPAALTDWLKGHGYQIPASIEPVIADYIKQQFGFLAMKLVPGAAIDKMQPVSISTPGASPALPLRMVAAGTGAKTLITLFVIAEGRYEPTNFPSFEIPEKALVWDWDTSSSNYSKLRDAAFKASGGFAWQVETSTQINKSDLLWPLQSAIEYQALIDELGYVGMTQEEALAAAVKDIDFMFAGIGNIARVTRLRAELSRDALGTDLVLGASDDQDVKQPFLRATQSVGTPDASLCPCGLLDASDPGLGDWPGLFGGGRGSQDGGGQGCSVAGQTTGGLQLGALLFLALAAARRRRERTNTLVAERGRVELGETR